MKKVNTAASAGGKEQDGKIRKLMELVENLNDEDLQDVLSYVEKYCSANETGPQCCPYCGGTTVIRYGRKHGKQRFLCKDCERTFVSTVNTVMYHSRQDRKVWNEVIRDTLKGESLEHTRLRLREELDAKISHRSLFFMRHKVLIALEALMGSTLLQTVLDIREPVSVTVSPETGSVQEVFEDPSVFLTVDENGETHDPEASCPDERRLLPNAALNAGTTQAQARAEDSVYEMDETYVLQSWKGVNVTKETHGRGPRKHGAVSSMRGISKEQICLVTGVPRQGAGRTFAVTVNRASPNPQNLEDAMALTVPKGSLVLCDGQPSYPRACEELGLSMRNVNQATKDERKLCNINRVNNFHAFIKGRYRQYRGVATHYINRYNTMWAVAYRQPLEHLSAVCQMLLTVWDRPYLYATWKDVKESGLTSI